MKRNRIIPTLVILLFCIQNFNLSAKIKNNSLNNKSNIELSKLKDSLLIELNKTITLTYLELSKMPPLKYYGFDKVEYLQESNPEIKKIWEERQNVENKISEFRIKRDSIYKEAKSKYLKNEISTEEFHQATKASNEYLMDNYESDFHKLTSVSGRLMHEYNIETIKIRVAESVAQRQLFSIDWIPEDELIKAKQTKEVKEIIQEINLIDQELSRRNK